MNRSFLGENMILEIKDKKIVDDIFDFLKTFNLVEQFLKDQNLKKLDDWEYPESDQSVIERYMEKIEGNWFIQYIEEDYARNFSGYFNLFKFKMP